MTIKTQQYVTEFLLQSRDVIDGISKLDIERIIEMLFAAWKNKNRVYLIGNGGSASTVTHFASDLIKTVVQDPKDKGLMAISLVENIPFMSAFVNDWGKEDIFSYQLQTLFSPSDLLIAFSVHGGVGEDKDGAWSQNLIKAIQYAKDNGGKTIGFAGFDGGVMKDLCDACVVVPAESTPLVESLHVLLTHLITFRLKELINEKEK